MECRYNDGERCCNGKSQNYNEYCYEPLECEDRKDFLNNTDEVLHRYLVLEKDCLRKINKLEEDADVKRQLNAIYSSKVELLEELIKELIE